MVVIDSEEEFSWDQPFSRTATSVTSMLAQPMAQDIFDRAGVVPTYVIDYPVAADARSCEILRRFLAAGRCVVGAHLHPWVNPPHDEEVNGVNSFPGNLPRDLERRKLLALTQQIVEGTGTRPVIYRAGRYGVGPATAAILGELGYRVDLSVVPHWDYRAEGGPDFRHCPDRPYWFGDPDRMLEIPLSCGFCGSARAIGPELWPLLESPVGRTLRAGGILSRLKLLQRARLTPEGVPLDMQCDLVRAMVASGHRVFTYSYHSPSLAAGHTPYVRSQGDLDRFLDAIRRFLDFFLGEIGGTAKTPLEVLAMVEQSSRAAAVPHAAH
jgi:hypothetical protein